MTTVQNPNWEAELSALEPGWDSYRAEPIDQRAIATMKRLLSETPAVVPLNDGGLQIEWSDSEIVIQSDGTMLLCE